MTHPPYLFETPRRFAWPVHYRITYGSWLLVILWFVAGFGWYVLTSGRDDSGAWIRLAILLALAGGAGYFLLRALRVACRVAEVSTTGLRLMSWGREEAAVLWSDIREIRENGAKKRLEVVDARGETIPLDFQLKGYDDLRELVEERAGPSSEPRRARSAPEAGLV